MSEIETSNTNIPEQQQAPQQEAKQRPIRTVPDGDLSAAIWERKNNKTGEPFFDTTIANNWCDENGQWHSNNNFSEAQLRRIPRLSANAQAIINGLRYERGMSKSDQADYRAKRETNGSGGPQRNGHQRDQ